MYSEIFKLYPDEDLFSFSMKEADGIVSYGNGIENEMSDFLLGNFQVLSHQKKFFNAFRRLKYKRV